MKRGDIKLYIEGLRDVMIVEYVDANGGSTIKLHKLTQGQTFWTNV